MAEAGGSRARSRTIPTIRAESWAQLTDLLYEDSWAESLGLYRSRYVFRGEPSPTLLLRTSLRLLGPGGATAEPHLLRNFRKFSPPDAALGDSVWNWLALAQHHGLPTRLLDWTFSPYVALHFATEGADEENLDPTAETREGAEAADAAEAVVWCVDFRRLHRRVPARLRRQLAREKADLFTTEMLETVAPRLDELPRSRRPYAVFFDPPALDAPLTNQSSVFSFLSDPAVDLYELLRDEPEAARRITIPPALRAEARDKLDQANVTERVLFPGLDGLARWLTRYYTPRRGAEATFRESPARSSRNPRRAAAGVRSRRSRARSSARASASRRRTPRR